MLTLYHGTRSVCSAKARIALDEKQLSYKSRIIDLYVGEQFDPAYLALNPMGVVPTLVDDRGPIVESSVIIQYVDDISDANRSIPGDPHDAALARRYLLRCLDVHSATNSLRFATAGRLRELRKSAAEREMQYRRMPDPAMAAKRKDLIDHGVESRFMDSAIRTFAGLFKDVDRDLSANGLDWILGDFSLADIALIAYVDRLDRLGLDGFWATSYPSVGQWLARFQQRPSYVSQVEAYNSPERAPDAYRRETGREAWPAIAAKLAAM